MGAAQSTHGTFSSHEGLLEKLAGQQDIEYSNAFWHQLFNLQRSLAAEDPAVVQDAMVPHCRQLLIHNPVTHNFQVGEHQGILAPARAGHKLTGCLPHVHRNLYFTPWILSASHKMASQPWQLPIRCICSLSW